MKKKKTNNIIMGALVGASIGSVLGMTLAPKKGKEIRKNLKAKGKKWFQKGKELTKKFKKEHHDEIEEITQGIKREGGQVFKIVKDRIEEIKKEKKLDESRQIPHEE